MSIALPDIPSDLAGWQWRRTTDGGALLESPDGWQTKVFTKSVNKAIGEARRYKLSQPKADRAAGDQVPAHLDPRLPRIPVELAAWSWRNVDGEVGLVNPPEGWATGFYPFLLAGDAIAEARAIAARDAALLAETAPATAWQPGPDASGVYRRPPNLLDDRLLMAPRDLVDGRWQPRETYDEAALAELTASIREHGILEDLIALVNERGELELITGHRRKRAATAAGVAHVPVKVVEVTLQQATEIAIISNDQRADLSDLERGRAYEKMIAELGISEAKLAERLGRPRAYIQQRRLIAAAAPELQRAVASGELGFTHARAICLGSGGDHKVQAAVVGYAFAEIRADRPDTATALQRRAEQTVRERHAKDLQKLGWKYQKFYRGAASDLHLYYARTAKPAEWSSGEILAAVREARRPPDGPEPAPLAGEDRAALEVAGWRIYVENYCAPWTIIERGKEIAWGDAGDLAEPIRAAKEALAKLAARFTAKGWTVEPKGRGLKLTPPTPEPEPGSKKKPKKLSPVEASFADAEKVIRDVEQGAWKPEPARSSSSSSSSYTCKRCKTRIATWSETEYINGDYHCKACAELIKAEHAALKAKFATVIDQQLGTWLDTAPQLAATLVVLKSGGNAAPPEGPERGAALRQAFTEWLWGNRDRFKLVEQPAAEAAPATAVAPPPTAPDRGAETPAPAEPLTFAEILSTVAEIEERWAADDGAPDDAARLDELVDALEALAGDEMIPTEAYEAAQRQLGNLLARLDEEGVPS